METQGTAGMAFQEVYLFLQFEWVDEIVISIAKGRVGGSAAGEQPDDVLAGAALR